MGLPQGQEYSSAGLAVLNLSGSLDPVLTAGEAETGAPDMDDWRHRGMNKRIAVPPPRSLTDEHDPIVLHISSAYLVISKT